MDNFSVHKWLRETHLNEDRGVDAARKLIDAFQSVARKLDDDELETLKKRFFKAILLDSDYEKLGLEEEETTSKKTIPAYKIHFDWAFDVNFRKMWIYKTEKSQHPEYKLDYLEAKAFLSKYDIKPELPDHNNASTEKDIQAIYDQLRNREVIVEEGSSHPD